MKNEDANRNDESRILTKRPNQDNGLLNQLPTFVRFGESAQGCSKMAICRVYER